MPEREHKFYGCMHGSGPGDSMLMCHMMCGVILMRLLIAYRPIEKGTIVLFILIDTAINPIF